MFGSLKNWLGRVLFKMSTSDQVGQKSLFKLIPFTFVNSFIFGVPLSAEVKFHHRILFSVSLSLRLWVSYVYFKKNIERQVRMDIINQWTFYTLSYVTLGVFVRKRVRIANYLLLDPSLGPKLRKIDLLSLLFFLATLGLTLMPLLIGGLHESNEQILVPSFFDFCPLLKRIIFWTLSVLYTLWFHLVPLCASIYALGYCVLYDFKYRTLATISDNWATPHVLILKLRGVSLRQEQFESTFGPFLLVCLFYNFIVSVYLFCTLKLLNSEGLKHYYFYITFCFYIQAICIGLILSVSHFNEKLKVLSNLLLGQIKLKLGQDLQVNSCLINFWQNEINNSINEPLTACKLLVIDRQIVLTIAASCVSFSVLWIQINNGALNS